MFGHKPPAIPPGSTPFASQDDVDGHVWSVRVAMPGEEPTSACKRISPKFTLQTTAYAYLDWVTGEAKTFEYPAEVA